MAESLLKRLWEASLVLLKMWLSICMYGLTNWKIIVDAQLPEIRSYPLFLCLATCLMVDASAELVCVSAKSAALTNSAGGAL